MIIAFSTVCSSSRILPSQGWAFSFSLASSVRAHGLFTVDVGIFRDEYLGERYDILRSLPQGRDLYVDRIDTIQQVLAELLFLYHLLQVPVRGADQADIDGIGVLLPTRTMLRRCKAVSNLACR